MDVHLTLRRVTEIEPLCYIGDSHPGEDTAFSHPERKQLHIFGSTQ